MPQDKWTDRLSEFLDGELEKRDREALEEHLKSCGECSAALDDLRAVMSRARSLDDRPPARDLWAGIAERIGTASGTTVEVSPIQSAPSVRRAWAARRLSFSMPQLAAAAVALIAVSGGAVGAWITLSEKSTPASATAIGQSGAITIAAAANVGGAMYDSAVVELEQALAVNRGQLDTATVRIIEENLAIIDQAIDQARTALAADPGSVYLSNHLAATLKRKVELLRHVTGLTAVQS